MFAELEKINARPTPFEFYTADDLWTDEHTSRQMLAYHLDGDVDVSSRNTAFIDRSVAWIAERFKVAGLEIADFGCGPGLYASRLARCGAKVTGIDFSRRSIDYAKQAAAREQLDIRYIHQNYLEFDTEQRFDLVLMIMCDFCALSPDQRAGLLHKFHRLLKPGGAVLLDVYSLQAFEQREEGASYALNQLNGFWSPNKYYGFLNRFKYTKEKLALDKYTIVEAERTRIVYNWLQHFSAQDLAREFTRQGFTIDSYHADVTGTPYEPQALEFAVVAKHAPLQDSHDAR